MWCSTQTCVWFAIAFTCVFIICWEKVLLIIWYSVGSFWGKDGSYWKCDAFFFCFCYELICPRISFLLEKLTCVFIFSFSFPLHLLTSITTSATLAPSTSASPILAPNNYYLTHSGTPPQPTHHSCRLFKTSSICRTEEA